MDQTERITIDPRVLVGKPVIRGTRIAVELVVSLLGQGWKESDIIRNYPGITHEEILACLQYAADLLAGEEVYPAATCPEP